MVYLHQAGGADNDPEYVARHGGVAAAVASSACALGASFNSFNVSCNKPLDLCLQDKLFPDTPQKMSLNVWENS